MKLIIENGRATENLEAQFVEPPFLNSRTPNFSRPPFDHQKAPRFRGTPARGLGCKLPVGIAKAHFRSIFCCTKMPRLRRAGDLSVHLPSTLLDLSPVSFQHSPKANHQGYILFDTFYLPLHPLLHCRHSPFRSRVTKNPDSSMISSLPSSRLIRNFQQLPGGKKKEKVWFRRTRVVPQSRKRISLHLGPGLCP